MPEPKWKDAAKALLPPPARAAARLVKLRLLACRLQWSERQAHYDPPLPPPWLRHRVHGEFSPQSFLAVGDTFLRDATRALKDSGKEWKDFRNVLDFGCGCGRLLRALPRVGGSFSLTGTDIDRAAVAWCRKNLGFARIVANSPLPPLPFATATFDLALGMSVFTHLDREYQRAWLSELARVLEPGGLLLLSTHGRTAARMALAGEALAEFEARGFLFYMSPAGRWKEDGLPGFYQTAFETREHVIANWEAEFELVSYREAGLNHHQDLALLRRRFR